MTRAPANDVLLFMPRCLRLDVPLQQVLHATLQDDGRCAGEGMQIVAGSHGAYHGQIFPTDWLARFCAALVAAGHDADSTLVVTRWDRTPAITVFGIGHVGARRVK